MIVGSTSSNNGQCRSHGRLVPMGLINMEVLPWGRLQRYCKYLINNLNRSSNNCIHYNLINVIFRPTVSVSSIKLLFHLTHLEVHGCYLLKLK